jgi:rod shape-determining protein MreC
MTAAKVIRRRSSAFWNSLIIDKGSLDGIGTDSPVITSVGLVGKTSILAPRMTEVILLTDEMCRVSAKVEGTLEQGILAGERAALEVRPELHLRFLSRNANINAGASVYSSGEGGVFPPDLLLGRVKRFENREISGEAIVEPAVDFSSLDHVFVIEMQAVVPMPDPPATTKP